MGKKRSRLKPRARRQSVNSTPGESQAVPREQTVATQPVKRPAKEKAVRMTKAQKRKYDWEPERMGNQVSSFLETMTDEAAKQFADPDVLCVGAGAALVVGVPVQAFSLEYLLQNTVWPLGRLTQILGTEGSFKSAFFFELVRWFIVRCHGIGVLLEHESKFSEDWAASHIGWEYTLAGQRKLAHWPCDSINHWQQRIMWSFAKVKRQMMGTKTDKGPGMVYPVIWGVDSIMGKAMQETMDRIEKKGFADRDYPLEAKSITSFLRALPSKFRQWPFHVVVVNQLKPAKDSHTGALIRNKAGGGQKEFQETFELELKTLRPIEATAHDGVHLSIKCYKNSLGITGRKIPVDVVWWDEETSCLPDSPFRQKTIWNWHASSIQLLLTLKEHEKDRIKTIIDLHQVSLGSKGNGVWSKALGISKGSPVPYYKAGEILMNTPGVLCELRRAFGVKVRKNFEPGVDYRKQLQHEKRKIAAKLL